LYGQIFPAGGTSDFNWPTNDEIRIKQHEQKREGRIWVPTQDLRIRILVLDIVRLFQMIV
jgi:hypothetical protein